ncbi:hypothetical protein SAMN05216223_13111 [Actinacidiphila yanglinensis]|uniref:Uncharacterized protein n=1 Tax=Actinacidiphila yanglinensis TaxID=310779 RepID=A0A1H6ECT3_9ACTN|nr:hypothetical protein [Actinacidiphila yanglinensis]SEG94756.1 hypothetical protein SAMN05216223_13111 [Actinacidiphila yanglinensis]
MHDARTPLTGLIHPGWFPLVPRSRPPCRPVRDRIGELQARLAQPPEDEPHRQLVQAAEVCNKAALIASDCGLPELARALCRRQHDVFDHAHPLPASAVKLAVQPLLNLPRQMIREGNGQEAYALLDQLYQAARDRTNLDIDGWTVNLRGLTSAPDDHKTAYTLIWTALLADGTRALALAGRWREAAEQAAAHRGIGARLLDGRQAAILALIQEDQCDRARTLVDESLVNEPWESAVKLLLRVLCRPAAKEHARAASALLGTVRTQTERPDPSLAVFHTRLGITALDLADGHDTPKQRHLSSSLLAIARNDAHAARTVLDHPTLRAAMTKRQLSDLNAVLDAASLGSSPLPATLVDALKRAASAAEERLRGLLGQQRDTAVPRTHWWANQ